MNIHRLVGKLKLGLQNSFVDFENIMQSFSIFGLFSFPGYYFINRYLLGEGPGNTTEIVIRLTGTILCLLLIVKRFWPPKLMPYLPIVAYISLFVFMPILGAFMALKNHCSAAWILNFLSILILMMLLVNHIIYVISLIIGTFLGVLAYTISVPRPFPFTINSTPLTTLDIVNTIGISLIMGMIFSRKKGLIERAKLEAMRALGSNIAHELRTPLASIQAGLGGIQLYLPKLLKAYDLAKQQTLPVPEITPHHHAILSKLTHTLSEEITLSNTMIDMMLAKIHPNLPTYEPHPCSVKACVDQAIARYPFNEEEYRLIHIDIQEDFSFEGEELLLVHVLFNLFKNALFAVQRAGKGEIYIWTATGPKSNTLYFKDTAQGVSPTLERTIFRPFYTYTYNGTGLGLAFCKSVMDQFNGTINYRTQYGEFLEFALGFKPVPKA